MGNHKTDHDVHVKKVQDAVNAAGSDRKAKVMAMAKQTTANAKEIIDQFMVDLEAHLDELLK